MNKEFITLATLTYMRAQLLCARLEEEKIACFMTHVNRIKEGPGGVEIIIRSKDAAKAFSIRDDFLKAYGSEKQPAINFMRIARRILVPFDFTLHAENAAFYALKIAAKMKADIQLLHVYFDPGIIPFSQFESFSLPLFPDDTEKEMEKETAEKLEAFSQKLQKILKQHHVKGVNVFYDLVKGSTVSNILSYIKIYKPGVVIMGTRGSELERFRSFGSVTAKIMKKAAVPVLAVPKDYRSDDLKPPQKVLYATDLDSSDYWALSKLSTFVKPFGAKIFCLHVSEEIEKSEEVYLHKLKKFLQETLHVEKLECGLLECLDPQLGLEDFIKEKKIDLVVMTTRQRNLITRFYTPGVTQKFLFQTSIPLMVFHALQ
ncbi:universal stress protein [Candidatus Sulfidibacterium hydrothermale]|uniref:universal stress protein n=1 Tax=Candidatus Sulfidibacterium hydrothermale TaxID=2875962 RepID=UPI001F0A92DE|nr:universal stress protein [Candidatus Sulfidibacterium hydrothermale]UBM62866.1 universal stress protein [Candidatus Sulfidibacterium hydrothermale]